VAGIYLITADGTLTTVAESGVPPVQYGPRINNNGTVTFAYGVDAYCWHSGAGSIDIAALTPQLSSSSIAVTLSNVALNNSGTAVFALIGRATRKLDKHLRHVGGNVPTSGDIGDWHHPSVGQRRDWAALV
jgi:hypothetical protein